MRSVAMLLATATLFVVIAVQVAVPRLFPERRAVVAPLPSIVAPEVPGWTVQTLPIAETEELQAHVNKVLRYDEAIFRSYRRGSLQVGIYAAHWQPGKASLSEAGAHTPDTCWVVAGWNRAEREHDARLAVDDRLLLPAELGTFEKDGVVQHVMFWHLAGGRPIYFDQNGWDERWPARVQRALSFITDLRRFGFDQRCDQCFVRITTNVPIRTALADPEFRALLARCAPLGIFAAAKS